MMKSFDDYKSVFRPSKSRESGLDALSTTPNL